MANILLSYTSADRDWAFWIAAELEALGHIPYVQEWELKGGDDIMGWMEQRHSEADHVLCVVSTNYLKQPYGAWERRAAQWAASSKRPNFTLPVLVEACETPSIFAHLVRCDLFGLDEDEARARLTRFAERLGESSKLDPWQASRGPRPDPIVFPGNRRALSNLPVTPPQQFLGRDDVLSAIREALALDHHRLSVVALQGPSGIGKSTLAAAFAERYAGNYRTIWWVRAGTESTLRADLAGLGVRRRWIAPEDREAPAIASVMDQLSNERDRLLLIFDDAADADSIRPYLPPRGTIHVLVTSTSTTWRGIAAPVLIGPWPVEVGADYLIARTGNVRESATAELLSEALDGLPLTHELAAAYCDRLGVSFIAYRDGLHAALAKTRSDHGDAVSEYENRSIDAALALAIGEVCKSHPDAALLIAFCAFLPPEPIPVFLLAEGHLASSFDLDRLDESLANLRSFGLVTRELIPDERDPDILIDTVRMHPLVSKTVRSGPLGTKRNEVVSQLILALAVAYRFDVLDPRHWPHLRRLDPLALAMVEGDATIPPGAEESASYLLVGLSRYRLDVLGLTAQSLRLAERALTVSKSASHQNPRLTAANHSNLGAVLFEQGDFTSAESHLGEALAIYEKELGSEDVSTIAPLGILASVLQASGDLAGAGEPFGARAWSCREKSGAERCASGGHS